MLEKSAPKDVAKESHDKHLVRVRECSFCLKIISPLGTGGEELGVFTHADFTFLLLRCVCLFLGLLVGG